MMEEEEEVLFDRQGLLSKETNHRRPTETAHSSSRIFMTISLCTAFFGLVRFQKDYLFIYLHVFKHFSSEGACLLQCISHRPLLSNTSVTCLSCLKKKVFIRYFIHSQYTYSSMLDNTLLTLANGLF